MSHPTVKPILRLLLGLQIVLACSTVPPQLSGGEFRDCHSRSGGFPDTLSFVEEVSDAHPPVPRPPHLAPYPPASEGEHTISYNNSLYYASGPLLRLSSEAGSQYKFIKIGRAELVPLYVPEEDVAHSSYGTVIAPITDDCVFLPFRHRSEMH